MEAERYPQDPYPRYLDGLKAAALTALLDIEGELLLERDGIEAMLRFLLNRYARNTGWTKAPEAPAPVEYPDCGLYHPDLPERIRDKRRRYGAYRDRALAALPQARRAA